MTDPNGQPAVSRLLDQQEAMARTLTEVQVTIAKMDQKLETMCMQRKEQHADHVACLASRETSFASNEDDHEQIWAAINRLTTWGKAVGVLGSIVIAILSILNILLSIGVKL